jgi:hypothetical protein
MKKLISVVCMALGLVACGGGGGSSVDATGLSADALKAKVAIPDPTLAAQAISVVNTTTAGDQVLRSIGALNDGGYTVAWISDNTTLFIQRYDSAGNKVGGEISVPLVIQSVQSPGAGDSQADPAAALRESSVAVLGDGSVVVAYQIDRFVEQIGAFFQFKEGIYIQRFDANGAQLLGETEVFSQVMPRNSRPVFLTDPKIVPLTDGGFTVAWIIRPPALTLLSKSTLMKRRYDSQAQPVGDVVTVGRFLNLGYAPFDFRLAADATGGYTVSPTFSDDVTGLSTLTSAIHYDAADTATQIVAPRIGGVLLLALEGARFVRFTSDSSGTFRQFLDNAGNPVGDPIPMSSMSFAATELMDGSFVLFWNIGGTITAQRFDSTGAPMGNLLTLQTSASVPGIAPLIDGGFAAAWSAPSTAGDLDVFSQRFIEVLTRDQAALRAKRKACLADAKGMGGRERKAFMDACLSS